MVVSILLEACHTQTTRFEFFSDIGKDARFQVLADVLALVFAPEHNGTSPLGTGKREIKGRFQILFRVMLMSNNEVHGFNQGLV